MAKIPKQNILYINFEDDRLLPLHGSELSQLLDIYRQSYQPNKKHKIYLFLDEVQNVPDWEHAVRRIYETEAPFKSSLPVPTLKYWGLSWQQP